MNNYRVVVIALLGGIAISFRTIQPNAPFVWVGRGDMGTVVWTVGDTSIPFDHQHPIPYLALGLPVPVNTATADTLESIPGLCPVKSQAVVTYRKMHGCFTQLRDLEAVHGIGPKTVRKVAPYLRIGIFDDRACASPLGG